MGRFQKLLAAHERRKSRRYVVHASAEIAIDDHTTAQTCMIHNISQSGALIEVTNGEVLGEFTLMFSRRCRVVRKSRDGTKFGVEFIDTSGDLA